MPPWRNRTMSPLHKGPEFSGDREFKVILEDIRSQFRAFGEGMDTVQRKLDALEGLPQAVKELQEDVGLLKIDVSQLKTQMAFVIDKVLPTVATKDDLFRLEKRLTTLESSR